MIWTKYTIQSTTKDADFVSALLMEHDICDVQIENNVQLTDEELNQMYADFVKELPEDDGSCNISFYIEQDENANPEEIKELLDAVRADLEEATELFGIAPVELVCETMDSADWENNWKAYFKPFAVDDILITPTWEEIPEEEEKQAQAVIRIDPGMAFGTGMHETTRLCLRGLRKYLQPGMSVLDLGCGSGILGIAALKLGAGCITSVDIDAQAVAIAKENYEVNEMPAEQCVFMVGDATSDEALIEQLSGQLADLAVVNILADVIAVMMPYLDRFIKSGGVLVTSGILAEKEQLVKDAIAANPALAYVDTVHDGDWVSITARKES